MSSTEILEELVGLKDKVGKEFGLAKYLPQAHALAEKALALVRDSSKESCCPCAHGSPCSEICSCNNSDYLSLYTCQHCAGLGSSPANTAQAQFIKNAIDAAISKMKDCTHEWVDATSYLGKMNMCVLCHDWRITGDESQTFLGTGNIDWQKGTKYLP